MEQVVHLTISLTVSTDIVSVQVKDYLTLKNQSGATPSLSVNMQENRNCSDAFGMCIKRAIRIKIFPWWYL